MLKITRKQRIEMTVIVLIAFVIMLIIAAVAFVLQTDKSAPAPAAVEQVSRPTLQSGWEYYTNKKYGFTIAHLTAFGALESIVAINYAEPGASRDSFEVDFQQQDPVTNETDHAPLRVRVSSQTLDQAVAGRKAVAAESGPNVAIGSQITRNEPLTVAGHRAVRMDQKDIDQTPGQGRQTIIYTTYIFVAGPKYTYMLETTSLQQGAIDDPTAQTMLASFSID